MIDFCSVKTQYLFMKEIYLDVCSLCRPFDDQSYARIRIETDAVNLILSKVRIKKYVMLKSPVHIKEIEAIDNDFERLELFNLINTYGTMPQYDSHIVKKRTEELITKKFGIADAAHVAFSEFFGSCFISCDDKLIKKSIKNSINIECMNPVIFCEMESLK